MCIHIKIRYLARNCVKYVIRHTSCIIHNWLMVVNRLCPVCGYPVPVHLPGSTSGGGHGAQQGHVFVSGGGAPGVLRGQESEAAQGGW